VEELTVKQIKVDMFQKKADVCSKQSDTLYKKAFIILAVLGGLGTLLIKVETTETIQNYGRVVFILLSVGLLVIYLKLSMINKELKKILNEIKRIINE